MPVENKRTFSWNGPIGPYININSATEVADYLEENKDNRAYITISSGGGDPYAADAIVGKLEPYKSQIKVEILGMVASAASHIALSIGDKVVARGGSTLMIHNSRVVLLSPQTKTKEQLEKEQEVLQKIDDRLAAAIVAKSGLEETKVRTYMKEEKEFTAEEALKDNLVDEILTPDSKFTEAHIKEIRVACANEINFINNKVKSEPEVQTLEENMSDKTEEVQEQETKTVEAAKEETPVVEVKETTKYVSNDQDILQRIEALEELTSYHKEVAAEAKAQRDQARKDYKAMSEVVETERVNMLIHEALNNGTIQEDEVDKWKRMLRVGGKDARELLANRKPDLFYKELGYNFSDTIESVPQNVRETCNAAGITDETEIVKAYQKAKKHLAAAGGKN